MKPYTLLRSLFFIVVAYGIAPIFYGCHKTKTDSTDGILTSGCYYAGDVIKFSYHNPAATAIHTLQWDFGDGTVVPNISTWHIYKNAGVYMVTLSVDGRIYTQNITISQLNFGSPYTDKMGGPRHWRSGVYSYLGNDTSTKDEQLTIDVLGPGMIAWEISGSSIYNLRSIDSIGKVLTFSDCLSSAFVYYYYDADSIVFYDEYFLGKNMESVLSHTVK